MKSQRIKAGIVTVTATSTALVIWNIFQESYILGTPQDVAICIAIWLVVPYVTMAIGLFSRNTATVHKALKYSLFLMAVFFFYAVNGSTQDREGAQHLHLILVPIILLLISSAVGLPSLVDWLTKGKKESQEKATGS